MLQRTIQRLKRSSWIRQIGGYVLAVGGMVWVLYDVHPRELLAHIVIRDWRWIPLAVCADILSYLAQGWRWTLLLSPLGNLGRRRATQAIYAGLFTNEILPLRIGEGVRAYLVSRWLNQRFIAVIPSIAVERLLDGVWLALGIGVLAVAVPLPRSIEDIADVFGIAVLVFGSLFLYLVFRRSHSPDASGRLRFLAAAARHFRQIADSAHFWVASLVSLAMVTLQALAFWIVMPAFGIHLPFLIGAAVFLIVHIGTAIPNAPGNAGSYQFFTVLGLTLFGIDKPTAAAFSFAAFFVLTVPLWIIGFVAFTQTGLSFTRLRQEIGWAARR